MLPSPSRCPLRKSGKYLSGIFIFPIDKDLFGVRPIFLSQSYKTTSPICILYACFLENCPGGFLDILLPLFKHFLNVFMSSVSVETKIIWRLSEDKFPSVVSKPTAYARFAFQRKSFLKSLSLGMKGGMGGNRTLTMLTHPQFLRLSCIPFQHHALLSYFISERLD